MIALLQSLVDGVFQAVCVSVGAFEALPERKNRGTGRYQWVPGEPLQLKGSVPCEHSVLSPQLAPCAHKEYADSSTLDCEASSFGCD